MNNFLDNNNLESIQTLRDLLTCFVATNGVGIEQGYAISQKLCEEEVVWIDFNASIIQSEEQKIYELLLSSSYPRGEYVARLVSNRICRAVEQINSQGGVAFLRSLTSSNDSGIRPRLLPLFGVGEKFISCYLELAGMSTD